MTTVEAVDLSKTSTISELELENRWFEEQFANRPRFATYGGHVTVVDVIPPNYEDQEDQTPVIFVPGFLANVDGFKLTMQAFAQSGKRAIGLNHSNRRGINDTSQPFHPTIVQKAEDVLTVIQELGLEATDVLCHSEGLTVSIVSNRIAHGKRDGVSPYRIIAAVAPHGIRQLDALDIARTPLMVVRGAVEMFRHPNARNIAFSTAKHIGKKAITLTSETLALRKTIVLDDLPVEEDYTDLGVLFLLNDEVISPSKNFQVLESSQRYLSRCCISKTRGAHHGAILSNPSVINESIVLLDDLRSDRKENQPENTFPSYSQN